MSTWLLLHTTSASTKATCQYAAESKHLSPNPFVLLLEALFDSAGINCVIPPHFVSHI
jgi:hypothetical protein